MSCIIDQGWTLGCNTIGGVEKMWIGTWSADATYQYDANNIVTGVTSGVTVYEMEGDIEFFGLVSTGAFSRENGTTFYESALSAKFIHLTAELRNLIVALGNAPLFAVVKSNAGEYYVLGIESAGRATEGMAQLGVLLGDMNGATLTFSWKSAAGAYLLDPAVLGTDIPIG
jgi:hypothetical protein